MNVERNHVVLAQMFSAARHAPRYADPLRAKGARTAAVTTVRIQAHAAGLVDRKTAGMLFKAVMIEFK